jgi:hypothetical protein
MANIIYKYNYNLYYVIIQVEISFLASTYNFKMTMSENATYKMATLLNVSLIIVLVFDENQYKIITDCNEKTVT